jgi:hypothetical protein
VTLGGRGVPVVGRVKLPPEVAEAAGSPPRIKLDIFLRPPSVSGPTDAVKEDFRLHGAFLQSAHGPLYIRGDVPVGPDGSFRVEGLPPQDYVVQVRVNKAGVEGTTSETLAGFAAQRFRVPSPRGAEGKKVADLGEIAPRPIPK